MHIASSRVLLLEMYKINESPRLSQLHACLVIYSMYIPACNFIEGMVICVRCRSFIPSGTKILYEIKFYQWFYGCWQNCNIKIH